MCFSIDVSILLLVIRAINTQSGKIHLNRSLVYPVFDWYCSQYKKL